MIKNTTLNWVPGAFPFLILYYTLLKSELMSEVP
jgi:hypothetical protein